MGNATSMSVVLKSVALAQPELGNMDSKQLAALAAAIANIMRAAGEPAANLSHPGNSTNQTPVPSLSESAVGTGGNQTDAAASVAPQAVVPTPPEAKKEEPAPAPAAKKEEPAPTPAAATAPQQEDPDPTAVNLMTSFDRSLLDPRMPALRQLQQQRMESMKGRSNTPSSASTIKDSYLAICTVVKDDPEALYEWLM
jgi:hypothetical protein